MKKSHFSKKTKLTGMLCCIFLAVVILNLNLISAGPLDFNKKYYDGKVGDYGKITIKDWWGLTNLAELELKENSDVCDGINCYSLQEITLHEDGILIENIQFIGGEISNYNITVDGNLYKIGTSMKAGTYQVRLEGQLNSFKSTDWQIKTYGFWTKEWAIWSSSFDDDLISYYAFDDGTGTNVQDNITTNNLTIQGSYSWVDGILGKAYNCSGTINTDIVNGNFTNITGNMPMSISVWLNVYTAGDNNFFKLSENSGLHPLGLSAQTIVYIQTDGSTPTTGYTIPTNKWVHLVVVHSQNGNFTFYVNGTYFTSVDEGTPDFNIYNLTLGQGVGWGGVSSRSSYDEMGIWNRTLTVSEVSDLWNNGVGLSRDAQTLVTLKAPTDNTQTINTTITFNSTGSTGNNFKNATLFLWNSTYDLFAQGNNTITGTNNATTNTITGLKIDSYKWNVEYCTDICKQQTANFSLNVTALVENSQYWNFTTYEQREEAFNASITFESATGSNLSGRLYYNNTWYDGTVTNVSDEAIFISNLTIPEITDTINITFNWEINITSGGIITVTNLTKYEQTVNAIYFQLCNNTVNIPYINFTFKDESTLAYINGSVDASTWVFWANTPSTNKTYTYINTSVDNPSSAFCFTPNWINITTNLNFQYSMTGYPQRTYTLKSSELTNTTTNKELYLLGSTDGIYVTFQVLDASGNNLEGVSVVANRTIGGTLTTVGKGTTDAAGTVTFWLNPNYPHTLIFTKAGYGSLTETITPTQSLYTVTLGGQAINPLSPNCLRDITIKIEPLENFLVNDTTYNFNYTISSTYWVLSKYGFTLTFANGSIIGTQSETSTGGTIKLNANTYNQTRIFMEYYTEFTNSTCNNNYTIVWQIYTDSNFGISKVFSTLNTYISANLFGILGTDGEDYFGKALISCLVIVFVTGALTSRYGMRADVFALGILFGLTLFLNSIDFIPSPTILSDTAISLGDFLLVIIGIVIIGFIFKEEVR